MLFSVSVICLLSFASIDIPRELWRYEAMSNLYAPPLVAELGIAPGLEIIVSDSEAGVIRCISARGEELWNFDGVWKKRLISPAALSAVSEQGLRKLVVANGDGTLVCIDAGTGTLLWRRDVGRVEWGGALWAQFDANGQESVVVGTEDAGVFALDGDGEMQWHFSSDNVVPSLHIRGPLAVCDVYGDGVDEIFGLSRFGPFALDAAGKLLWKNFTGDDFPGGPVIADTDLDGYPELYAVSVDDAYLWCFDAVTGDVVWNVPLYGRVDTYSASSIAVGDITGDGVSEIVTGDGAGTLYAFRRDGVLLWTFSTQKPVHITVSLGDVTGNGRVDVLAACGDHFLYCLSGCGQIQWRYKTDLRLIYPATLADLDHSGTTDIVVCGSDRTLRRLTLEGRYSSQRMPWPSRRFDAAQRGASFHRDAIVPRTVTYDEMLVVHGDFEQGKVRDGLEQFDSGSPFYERLMARPRGWRAETFMPGAWGLSDANVYSGDLSLEITAPMTMVSEPFDCVPTWRKVSAEVFAFGQDDMRATLRWSGNHGIVREDPLSFSAHDGVWTRLAVDDCVPPGGARRLVMALQTTSAPVYWDNASIRVIHEERADFEVLVNQAGYDLGAPKRVMAQANFRAERMAFVLIDKEGIEHYKGELAYAGRIHGHYGNDWGYEYYSGEFSDFDAPGIYRVRVSLDDISEYSWPVVIGKNQLWNIAARPAYRFFFYQRCGTAVPGFYDACHLDDAVSPDGATQYDLWGGWHDAGDYNKYHNAPYVYGLAVAYDQRRTDFDALGATDTGASEFLDEILWGGDHVRRMVMDDGSAFGHITSGYGYWGPPELETDNIPGTGDERRGTRERGDNPDAHQAALARIAVLLKDTADPDIPLDVWVNTAAHSLSYALDEGRRGLWQLSTAVDLYDVTGDTKYALPAETLREELMKSGMDAGHISAMHVEVIRRYDDVFHSAYAATLREAVIARAASMLANATNPFGVYTFGPPEQPDFFNTPADQGGWHVGTSSHLLEAAAFMAIAFQYEPDHRYLRFVYDQFNWTLGMNPYNISLMEGVGSAFAPTYHHRYTFAGVPRGAVPGGVVNGITWRSVGDDRPFFDMSGVDIPAYESNEVWLPHNTAFLNALAQLMNTKNN